ARALELSVDGRMVSGEDVLLALEGAAKKRFDKALDSGGLQGIGYDLRFRLHPEVDAARDLGGAAVSMALKSGEIW
ncbi:heparinase II/III family protein, partial [Tritonibacter sp. SIMBA_163]|uniref:heparinase II/III domain-containing protein n=1 Tax=Tritonibacter sp. SIMBA_163 TaxID=3080868 RepID=UPI0039812FB6